MMRSLVIDDIQIEDFRQSLLWIAKNASQFHQTTISLFPRDSQDVFSSQLFQNNQKNLEYSKDLKDYPLFLQTSGSSGTPKVIKKTFFQMCEEGKFLAHFIEEYLGIKDIKEILCSVQAQHLFGLSFGVFMPLFLKEKARVRNVQPYIEYIMEHALDVLITSPTLLKGITQHSQISSNFQNLKLIISAGSPLSNDVREKLQTQAQILDIYGSSETGVIAYSLGDGLKRFYAVNLSCNASKELIVSSPWCDEVQTSDIAELNGDDIVLLGRSDAIVKINDKRFSLYEIELKIKCNPLILDCIAYPKENRLAVLLALTQEGVQHFRLYGKQGIVENILKNLEIQNKSYLRFFKIVSQIPRNIQGKISKQEKQDLITKKEKIVLKQIYKDANQAIFEGVITEGCFYFDGHFIDFPLVPGFIEVQLALEYAEVLGIDFLHIRKIPNMKFSAFLRPRDFCRLELERKEKYLIIKMFANDIMCFSGKILIEN